MVLKKYSRRFACGLTPKGAKEVGGVKGAQSLENLGKLGNLEKLVKSTTNIYPLSSLHSLNSLNSLINHLPTSTTQISCQKGLDVASIKKLPWMGHT